MRGILEFNLEDTFEKNAHTRAMNATEAYLVLHELDQDLRQTIKYQELTEEVEAIYSAIREKLHEYMNRYGVDLNDLD